MNKVFYVPGTAHAIDYAREMPDGRCISYWQGRTLEEIAEDHPGAILCDEAEFLRQQSAALKQPPQAITERECYEALEVMPPLNWRGAARRVSSRSCSASFTAVTSPISTFATARAGNTGSCAMMRAFRTMTSCAA
ncbi:hypothetical protein [Paraburkholderia sp. BR10882]|uniref:hypothetical protein n=1 Tax=unclassified Paraburkholderia TaxID=2615204 RepID=UPI0034CE2C58